MGKANPYLGFARSYVGFGVTPSRVSENLNENCKSSGRNSQIREAV